jgi:hypothetical protein
MKVWKTAAAVALSVTVIAGYSFAQSANGQGMGTRCAQRFAALDANGDGVLTTVEFCPGS